KRNLECVFTPGGRRGPKPKDKVTNMNYTPYYQTQTYCYDTVLGVNCFPQTHGQECLFPSVIDAFTPCFSQTHCQDNSTLCYPNQGHSNARTQEANIFHQAYENGNSNFNEFQ
ncbi:2284_t:CDS:1, partial [Racocetra fulgida]